MGNGYVLNGILKVSAGYFLNEEYALALKAWKYYPAVADLVNYNQEPTSIYI